MEIRTGAAQCLTVNTGKDTNITVSNGKHGSHFARFVGYVVRVVQNLVVVLHALVYVVVNAMLRKFTDKAINPGVGDNVDIFRVTVSPHNRVNIAQNLGRHLGWNLYHVARLRVIKQRFEHLRFVCLQCGNGSDVQFVRQSPARLFHFAQKVVFVGNLVVHVGGGNHCKANGISRPNNRYQCGRIFIVSDNARTDIANLYIAVVIDNGYLYRVTNRRKRTVTQIGVND